MDFNTFYARMGELDFYENSPAKDNMPDSYYLAYGALYSESERQSHLTEIEEL
jgi:hypothetical protein